jgi:hypothetical protein
MRTTFRRASIAVIALTSLLALGVIAPTAGSAASIVKTRGAGDDYSSFFTGSNPGLVNSGWSRCGEPITWSVDTRDLTRGEAARETARIRWAFDRWSAVTGLRFANSGEVPIKYDNATFRMSPADGSPTASRHIYLAFMRVGESSLMVDRTYGFGSPMAIGAGNQITVGAAAFRTEQVKVNGARDPRALKSLYLHEIGHVLGLAHASNPANIMFPIVTNQVALGPGDVKGVRVMTKPCPAVSA